MPSPFPGMNPYLEQKDVWQDFHQALMPAIRVELSSQVDPNYIVKLSKQLVNVDFSRRTWVEILRTSSRKLVTIIQVLCPGDERMGTPSQQFPTKSTQKILNANFVEIDLLRGGPRRLTNDIPPFDYSVWVSRFERSPEAYLWPFTLRDPIPVIPIPLKPTDPDARLDLQALLHQVYDGARYQSYIYEGKPEPPLSPEQEEWARQFLPTKG